MPLSSALDEMAAVDRPPARRPSTGSTTTAVRGPSLLPGWTRGHVLTHLARNADGDGQPGAAARTGDGRPMYPGGARGAGADIEAGAGRHLGDLRLDLAESAERLLAAFADDFPAEAQAREVAMRVRRDGVRLGDPADPDPRGRDPPRRPGRGLHAGRLGRRSSPAARWTSWRRSSATPATARSGRWWPPTATPAGRWRRRARSSPDRTELAAWLVGPLPGTWPGVDVAGAVRRRPGGWSRPQRRPAPPLPEPSLPEPPGADGNLPEPSTGSAERMTVEATVATPAR